MIYINLAIFMGVLGTVLSSVVEGPFEVGAASHHGAKTEQGFTATSWLSCILGCAAIGYLPHLLQRKTPITFIIHCWKACKLGIQLFRAATIPNRSRQLWAWRIRRGHLRLREGYNGSREKNADRSHRGQFDNYDLELISQGGWWF